MLIGLAIRNVVLIDQLSLTFADGLTALTGETGAGKSILLDALGLALGARSDAALVRHGADQATVTASFAVGPNHPSLAVVREQGLDPGDGLDLRRSVAADGRSRAFVNDQPVSVGTLRQLGQLLVEIHGQFDSSALLDQASHRALLDAFGGHDTGGVAAAWAQRQEARATLAAVKAEAERARAEEAFLRHALGELDTLTPQVEEEDRLAARRTMLMHREKLLETVNGALADLEALRGLGTARRQLERIRDKVAPRLDAPLEALDRAAAELAEATAALGSIAADVDLDSAELERLEERLFALRALARKHATDVAGLVPLRQRFAEQLALIDDRDQALARLARDEAIADRAYRTAATALSRARAEAAQQLDRAVAAELPPLRLGKARFETLVEALPETGCGPAGADAVSFAVATNPGAPAGPLARIASGGELARFMLALRVVLAATGHAPTLIFDEVDSGISGAVADAVGERLARLGDRLQVLTVTHSPQVAARASHHWRVEKAEAGGRAQTRVAELEPTERREEIARMLSGAKITEQARAAADSLMAAGR